MFHRSACVNVRSYMITPFVRDQQLRTPTIELKGLHLYFEPVFHLLVGSEFGVGIAGNPKGAHKQRRTRDSTIGVMD